LPLFKAGGQEKPDVLIVAFEKLKNLAASLKAANMPAKRGPGKGRMKKQKARKRPPCRSIPFILHSSSFSCSAPPVGSKCAFT
jgi:hypothetical protein